MSKASMGVWEYGSMVNWIFVKLNQGLIHEEN
jgi:hypothetical protein